MPQMRSGTFPWLSMEGGVNRQKISAPTKSLPTWDLKLEQLWGTGGSDVDFWRCYYSVRNADKREGNDTKWDKQDRM